VAHPVYLLLFVARSSMLQVNKQSLSLLYFPDLLHTHTQPFYGSVEFVRDNPGEPVPEETFTHYTHYSFPDLLLLYYCIERHEYFVVHLFSNHFQLDWESIGDDALFQTEGFAFVVCIFIGYIWNS